MVVLQLEGQRGGQLSESHEAGSKPGVPVSKFFAIFRDFFAIFLDFSGFLMIFRDFLHCCEICRGVWLCFAFFRDVSSFFEFFRMFFAIFHDFCDFFAIFLQKFCKFSRGVDAFSPCDW